MNSSQHGSSSGAEPETATPHGPAEFLIAQQQLNAVADILATDALQDVGEDRLRDISASLSAIHALLSPEQRHDSAEPIAEAKSDSNYDHDHDAADGGTFTTSGTATGAAHHEHRVRPERPANGVVHEDATRIRGRGPRIHCQRKLQGRSRRRHRP